MYLAVADMCSTVSAVLTDVLAIVKEALDAEK